MSMTLYRRLFPSPRTCATSPRIQSDRAGRSAGAAYGPGRLDAVRLGRDAVPVTVAAPVTVLSGRTRHGAGHGGVAGTVEIVERGGRGAVPGGGPLGRTGRCGFGLLLSNNNGTHQLELLHEILGHGDVVLGVFDAGAAEGLHGLHHVGGHAVGVHGAGLLVQADQLVQVVVVGVDAADEVLERVFSRLPYRGLLSVGPAVVAVRAAAAAVSLRHVASARLAVVGAEVFVQVADFALPSWSTLWMGAARFSPTGPSRASQGPENGEDKKCTPEPRDESKDGRATTRCYAMRAKQQRDKVTKRQNDKTTDNDKKDGLDWTMLEDAGERANSV
ncbi:hypothetical protein MKX08_009524 [Trichoderma sp. CBMAI-0020]|nr:hypothetical protein MKX08_009524 [Trichoderma sp. CBMAI-0020]